MGIIPGNLRALPVVKLTGTLLLFKNPQQTFPLIKDQTSCFCRPGVHKTCPQEGFGGMQWMDEGTLCELLPSEVGGQPSVRSSRTAVVHLLDDQRGKHD